MAAGARTRVFHDDLIIGQDATLRIELHSEGTGDDYVTHQHKELFRLTIAALDEICHGTYAFYGDVCRITVFLSGNVVHLVQVWLTATIPKPDGDICAGKAADRLMALLFLLERDWEEHTSSWDLDDDEPDTRQRVDRLRARSGNMPELT